MSTRQVGPSEPKKPLKEIGPIKESKSAEQLPSKGGILSRALSAFMTFLIVVKQIPWKMAQFIPKSAAQQSKINTASSQASRLNETLGGNLNTDQRELLENYLLQERGNDSTFSNKLADFLDNKSSKQVVEDRYRELVAFPSRSEGNKLFKNVINEIMMRKTLFNTQMLQNAVRIHYQEPKEDRDFPYLTTYTDPTFGIHFEARPSSKGTHIELNVSHPQTKETRHVAIPLPQNMGEQYLKLFHRAIEAPSDFDRKYSELGLPPQDLEKARVFIFKGIQTATAAVRAAIESLTTFTETPHINDKTAIKEAQKGNIYSLDDHLSLIPSETLFDFAIAERNDAETIRERLLLMLNERIPIVQIPYTPTFILKDQEIQLPLAIHAKKEIKSDSGTRFLEVTFEINSGTQKYDYTTYYKYQEGENLDKLLDRLVESRLFERDLLLAKAEWMRRK